MIIANGKKGPGSAAVWLRNAEVAVQAFIGVSALSGLGFVFYSAFMGRALDAIVGGLIAAGGMSAGFVVLAALHLGEVLLDRQREIDALAARVSALESAFDAQGVPIDLGRVSGRDPDRLVAANLDRDVFPRLAAPGEGEAAERPRESVESEVAPASLIAESLMDEATAPVQTVTAALELQWQAAYQDGDVATCRRTLEALRELAEPSRVERMEESLLAMSQARSAQLREEFARLIRERNFEAALLAGNEIERLFPGSLMAEDFHSLRPHLERRITHASHAPAV